MNIRKLILGALLLLPLVSCTKETLPSVVLSSNSTAVTIDGYTNKPAFLLEWTLAGGNADITKQYIQFSSDVEFLTTYAASSSGDSYVVTYKDLEKMNATFGVTTDYVLYVRMLIEGDDVPAVYSNKLKINVELPK